MRTFILYDEKTINRDGTRVLLSGLKLDAFKKNPVMLYMHSRGTENGTPSGSEVIGRWDNIRLRGTQLLADAVFDEKDEFSRKIAQKVKENFLRAASIGIEVVASSEEDKYKIEGQTGSSIVSSILLEASVVDIPKNSNALTNHFFVQKRRAAHLLRHHGTRARHGGANKAQGQASVEHLTAQVVALRKSLHKMECWRKNFLKEQCNHTLDNAIESGVIDAEQKEYYSQLLTKDFELGQKLIALQYKKWRNAFVGRTPDDLQNFLVGVRGSVSATGEVRQAAGKQALPNTRASEYEFMLKNRARELKEIQHKDPQKFKALLEQHLTWKDGQSTNHLV